MRAAAARLTLLALFASVRAVSVAQAVASRHGLARYQSRCIGPFLAVLDHYDDFAETNWFS